MKYMTFNNSCSFAGVANMLEDFSVDIEDYQLAIEMKIPYIFKYNKRYISGAMLQDAKYFNYCLQNWGLKLIENKVSKENTLSFLKNIKCKAMIGLNIKDYKHAVIYLGNKNNIFYFLNNRRKGSSDPEFYKFNSDELIEKITETIIISYIDKSSKRYTIDKEIQDSITYLER